MVDRFAVEKIGQNWQSILDLANVAHRSMELVGDDAMWAKKMEKIIKILLKLEKFNRCVLETDRFRVLEVLLRMGLRQVEAAVVS